ncbi:MAG: amidohydrolase family protein, partial [Bacteroidota bacterium]|nr:amidohydrolase family protein [Bacteroidota bacterium]
MKLKIHNARILTPYRTIPKGTVLITDGRITAVEPGDIEVEDTVEIDAQGQYVSPGFIDIHVHGGGGSDFMDGSEAAFLKIAETHAKHGTTALVPTTLTCEKEDLIQTLALYNRANEKNLKGAQFLGMHLEGPYLAMNQKGAQDARYISEPKPEEYKDILSRTSVIKRWSAAPELKGALEFAHYLQSRGILPAIAHSDAI